MKRLQDEIRKHMGAHRLKQEAFADLVGVSQGTVSRWLKERSPTKPDPDQVRRLSKILGVDALALIDDEATSNIVALDLGEARERPSNAKHRAALRSVCQALLDQLCATAEDREKLADSHYRAQAARVFAAIATAPLDHDAVLADARFAQQQARLLFHALTHREYEQ